MAGYEPGRPKLRDYYDVLNAWESFVLQAQMATDLYLYIAKEVAFEAGDGSPEQRLYELGNAVKHFRGHLNSKRFTSTDILPLWIDSGGLRSFDIPVRYDEAAGVLRNLASLADMLQDPQTVSERSSDSRGE